MGFGQTRAYGYLEVKSAVADTIEIKNSANSDADIAVIVLPSWRDPLTYAFLDLYVNRYTNSAALGNGIAGGSFGIEDTGATYYSAYSFSLDELICNATEVCNGMFQIPGTTNLKDHLTSGATQQVRLNQAFSWQDSLYLQNVFAVLRLYFKS